MDPQSLVYQGREATGTAQIFGREGNPFNAVRSRMADIEKKKAIEAEKAKLAKQERDKKMFEVISVSPEKTFHPFNQQVLNAAQEHRNRVMEYYSSGGTDNPQFQAWNKTQWEKVNDLARKGVYIQEKINATMEEIKKNPYLDQTYYFPKIWDSIMDAHGNGKPLDQINVDQIAQVYQQDPAGFNLDKYATDFYGNIKDNVFNWVEKRNTALGTETDDIELKVKGQLYQKDQNTTSGVVEDEWGNPQMNITNDVLNSFAGSPLAKQRLQQMAEEQGIDPREWLASRFKALGGGFNKNVRPGSKFYPGAYTNQPDETGIPKKDIPKATERMKNIGNILNAFWDEDGSRRDDPSPQAQAALSYIVANARFGDGEILDASFVPGTTKPGAMKVFDDEIENSPDDQIVFRVKYSDRGRPKTERISIDEMNAAQLNGIFNTSKTEGGFKIGYDQLRMLNQKKDNELFSSRIDRSYMNEQTANAEQDQIKSWQSYQDLDKMKGKVLNGKRIQSVSRKKSYGFFPSDLGIQVTYHDGSTEVIPVEEYDRLSEIHKAKKGNTGGTSPSKVDYTKLKY